MRLAGYPDEFIMHQEIEVFDAVIPPVAELLAKIARDSITDGEKVKKPVFSLVDWRPLGVGLTGKKALDNLQRKGNR